MLDKIIKAYDIRGLVKNEVTTDFSFALGVAYAKFLEIEREPATIVVGEDMRDSSAPLADAFSDGCNSNWACFHRHALFCFRQIKSSRNYVYSEP
jgi:phosphomannomutase